MKWSSDTQWHAHDRQKRSAAAGRETCDRERRLCDENRGKATSAIACIARPLRLFPHLFFNLFAQADAGPAGRPRPHLADEWARGA